MTLATQFRQAWIAQTKTISADKLARQLDPAVIINRRHWYPTGATFIFSDQSAAQTTGKGKHFTLSIISNGGGHLETRPTNGN